MNAEGALNKLDQVRTKINRVEIFGDFIRNSTIQLISYAVSLNIINTPLSFAVVPASSNSTANKARQIILQIQKNKRRQYYFFNEGQGKLLWLHIPFHELILADSKCFSYFGQFSIQNTGRISSSKCSLYQVYLCVENLHEHDRSCLCYGHKKENLMLPVLRHPNHSKTHVVSNDGPKNKLTIHDLSTDEKRLQ